MSLTIEESLAKVGASVPPHLDAEAFPEPSSEPQAQGDLLIFPVSDKYMRDIDLVPVPTEGVQVVFGQATGNSHWLHQGFDSPGVKYARARRGQRILVFTVPDGQVAELIHTDEHGIFAFSAGSYAIHDQREQADEIRRVTD